MWLSSVAAELEVGKSKAVWVGWRRFLSLKRKHGKIFIWFNPEPSTCDLLERQPGHSPRASQMASGTYIWTGEILVKAPM